MLLHRQRLLMVCVKRRNSAKQENAEKQNLPTPTNIEYLELYNATHTLKDLKNFVYVFYTRIEMNDHYRYQCRTIFFIPVVNSIFVEVLFTIVKRCRSELDIIVSTRLIIFSVGLYFVIIFDF